MAKKIPKGLFDKQPGSNEPGFRIAVYLPSASFHAEQQPDGAVAALQQQTVDEALIAVEPRQIAIFAEVGEVFLHVIAELPEQLTLAVDARHAHRGGDEKMADGKERQLVAVGLAQAVLPEPAENVVKGIEDLHIAGAVLLFIALPSRWR